MPSFYKIGLTQFPAFLVILSLSKFVRERVCLYTLAFSQIWMPKNPSKIQVLRKSYKKYLFLIFAIFLAKIILIGIYPLHHPSEARYTSIAMRMEVNHNYLMPFFDPQTPFFGKPPLSMWVSAIAFKVFGFSEFVARLPHLLSLILTCYLLYNTITKLYDKKTAAIATLILSSCFLFYGLHSVMTEGILLLGMTMISLSFLMQIESKGKNFYGYLFVVGCVIAALTKGPVGILMPGSSIFVYLIISSRWKEFWQKFPLVSGAIIFLCLTVPWFYLAEKEYPGFLSYFFIGENFHRFFTAGWKGDLYGNAHRVPFGTIWYFFALSTMPAIIVTLIKPKQIVNELKASLAADQKKKILLFFIISFIAPMIALTFMRNMIITYAIYALIPFVVLMAYIVAQKKWENFALFLGYFTLIIHLIIISVFLIKPQSLLERLNYHQFLIEKIPDEIRNDQNFKLYYLGNNAIFTLYWHTKDRVKILNNDNFFRELNSDNSQKYLIGSFYDEEKMGEKNRQLLNLIACTKRNRTCLWAVKLQNEKAS